MKIGIAREIITPEIGGRLMGYRPDIVSEGVNDDLTVTALAIDDEKKTALIISATVCLIDTLIVSRIKELIKKQTNISSDNIVIAATHTHSGPVTATLDGFGDVDENYISQIFIPKTLAAVSRAIKDLKLAKMGVGKAQCFAAVNRRESKNNSIRLGQDPSGIFDNTLTVLSFVSKNGQNIANIIHYGMHCTCAGANHLITRDWAGVAIDTLENRFGGITLFLNGAEGDVGPRLASGETVSCGSEKERIDQVMLIGEKAAVSAVEAYLSTTLLTHFDLVCKSKNISLPLREVASYESIQKELSAIQNPGALLNYQRMRYIHLKGLSEFFKSGKALPASKVLKQNIIILGEVAIVPFPFEMFSEAVLDLKAKSPYSTTLGVSCANGSEGYLPSPSEIERGGYEIDVFRSNGTFVLRDDASAVLIDESLKLLREIKI